MIIDRRGMGVWNIYFASRSNLPYPPPQWQLIGSHYSIVPIFLTLLTTTKGLLIGNNLLRRLIPLRNPLGSH